MKPGITDRQGLIQAGYGTILVVIRCNITSNKYKKGGKYSTLRYYIMNKYLQLRMQLRWMHPL